ncbi:probable cytochrome P450 6a13 [Neodiprion virginianus]|uniref:probable cytochrome P450 6a13 n=1 Tax=Neodiprion fabricii TaxID=2872261 RepID=UPI001ED8FBAA|nr:probable cytochrome P450 6a13 [Neodiprion fabricii]XP_046619854.1 probable cytochrome P450 6a13 [Neodiprion virginianus]
MFFQIAINLGLVLVGVAAVVYMLIRRQFTYWERKGVPYIKLESYLGTYADVINKKKSVPEMLKELFGKLKGERFGGVWEILSPRLFLVDPDVLRDIMVKNFDSWTSRGMTFNPEVDPLSQHVAMLDGKMWKGVRTKLTPTFTSARLKHMHYLLLECAKDLEKYLDSLAQKNEPIEAREVSAKFTTDVIGSCVFGIQMNSLSDEDAAFRKMGRKITDSSSFWSRFTLLVQASSPWLFKKLKLSLTSPDVEEFFLRITREAFEYREKNNVQRHDFIDLLRNLKNTDQKLGEDDVVFDDKLLTAQAYVFFGAGFETSSTTIGYALHELAVHQDIQERLRKELREMQAANKGEITWDGLQGMKYLDKVFQETLRKYPVIPQIERVSVKPYQLPGTNVVLPAGSKCLIPIYAFHHNPEFFPDPEKFDPERFTEEAKAERRPYTFIPFGGGPRNCIGSRFAEQQSKIGIVKVLDKFKLSLCDKSQNPLRYKLGARFLYPERGVWIKVTHLGANDK